MNKKIKVIISIICILILITMIRDLFNYFLIPKYQKQQVIRSFNDNFDKFENVHNYIVKTYPFSQINRTDDDKILVYSTDFNKVGEDRNVEVQINDKLVMQQLEFILRNLDFKYIENISDETHFVFRDVHGHFQSIDFYTNDISKINGWNSIKLKDNWYYRSIWVYFLSDGPEKEPRFIYWLRIVYHLIRGY